MNPTNQLPPEQQQFTPQRKKDVNYRKLLDRLMKSIPLLIVDDPQLQGYATAATSRCMP